MRRLQAKVRAERTPWCNVRSTLIGSISRFTDDSPSDYTSSSRPAGSPTAQIQMLMLSATYQLIYITTVVCADFFQLIWRQIIFQAIYEAQQ